MFYCQEVERSSSLRSVSPQLKTVGSLHVFSPNQVLRAVLSQVHFYLLHYLPDKAPFRLPRVEKITGHKYLYSRQSGTIISLTTRHHLQLSNPYEFLLTGSQFSLKTSVSHLLFSSYELHTSFRRHGGVCAYLLPDLPCTSHLESRRSYLLLLKVTFQLFVNKSLSNDSYNCNKPCKI